ncbi:MAG: hypothetical protein QOG54_938 [Actinomycetota bacterium]|nr:hypothetical protein [Actinomycetota bacterium]
MSEIDLEDLESTIKQLPGVLGCVVLRGVDGTPSEIQAFTQIGTDRDSVQAMILEEIARRDLGSPVSQVFVFELEAESYFGDLESLERAAEFAEQEAISHGPIQEGDEEAQGGPITIDQPLVATPPAGLDARPALRRVALSSTSWRSQAEVALGAPGTEVIGQASSEKTPHGLKVLAEATLEAVKRLLPDVEFRLRASALVNVSGQEAVLVIVQEEGKLDVLGAALTRGGPVTETTVRATLDAVNRRFLMASKGESS